MKVTGYTRLAILLAARIKKDFSIEVEPVIHRTRYSADQRASGAVSWVMKRKDIFGHEVASMWPATQCLKAKKLDGKTQHYGMFELVPND
jgi:hypothetical protein